MSTISFNVVAHDLASRVFRGVGNAAMAMAAKIRAADALAGRTDGVDRNSRAWARFRLAAERAAPAIDKLNDGLRRLTGDNIRGQGRMWFRLILTGLAMAPAVIGPAVYALGALEGAIVAVTPGAAALGLAMYGTWKRIKLAASSAKEFNKAAPAIQRAATAFKQLGTAYQGFLNKTSGPVGNIFTQLFKGASELLPKLVPMTNRFARVLGRFLHGVREDMKSPAFDHALNWLKRVGSVTFKNLLQSGKNLTTFFYNLARSFQKAGVDIKGSWLRDWTKSMSDWAGRLGNSEGFKRLIKFTKENWPKIATSIGNIFKTLGNITQGMEPIASKGLDALVWVTGKLAKVKPETWTKIGYGFIGLSVGIKALSIAMAGFKIAGMLKLFGALGAVEGGAGIGASLSSIGAGLSAFAAGLGAFAGTGAASVLIGKLLDKFSAIGPGGFFSQKNPGGIFGGMQMPKITQWIAGLGRQLSHMNLGAGLKFGVKLIPSLLGKGLNLGNLLGGIKNTTIKVGVSFVGAGIAAATRALSVLKDKRVRIIGTALISPWAAAARVLGGIKNRNVRLIGSALVSPWLGAARTLRGIKNRTVRLIGMALISPWLGAARTLRGIRNRTVRLIGTAATGAWIAARTLLRGIRNKTVRMTGTAATAAWSAAKRLLASIKNKIVKITGTAATGAWQAAKSLWASIHNKVVTITTVATTIIRKITGKAAGGPVKGRTPYVVGEVGPELFMPDTSGRIIPNHRIGQYANRVGGGNVYINVEVNGAIDPVATGREVQKALLALKRLNGGRALGIA